MKIEKLGFAFSILLMYSFIVLPAEVEDEPSDFFTVNRIFPINDNMDSKADFREVCFEVEVVHKKKMVLPKETLMAWFHGETRYSRDAIPISLGKYYFSWDDRDGDTLGDIFISKQDDRLKRGVGIGCIFCPNITKGGNGAIIAYRAKYYSGRGKKPSCEKFKEWLEKYHPEIK